MAVKGGTLGRWIEAGKSTINKAGGDFSAEAKRFGGNISGTYKTAAGDVSSALEKAKRDAMAQAQRSGGDVSGAWKDNIWDPAKKVGGQVSGAWKDNVWNPIQESMGGGDKSGGGAGAAPAPDYSAFKMNLAKESGDAERTSFSNLISGNETADGAKANIAQQYGSLGSLAKLREGTQRQTEQSAIARRLASSGMGASGAGMRMQQQADQASGRRAAETQLALGSEQARAEGQAQDAVSGRNLQREGMRMNAAQGESDRAFREREFQYKQDADKSSFEREGAVIAENQKIAREVQRYNERGLFGQLLGDLFGGGAYSTKYPLGQR
jgi:hypothetical protein